MRGLQWFNALSAGATPVDGLPASLKVADGVLGEQAVRFLAVVTDDAGLPVEQRFEGSCARRPCRFIQFLTPGGGIAVDDPS